MPKFRVIQQPVKASEQIYFSVVMHVAMELKAAGMDVGSDPRQFLCDAHKALLKDYPITVSGRPRIIEMKQLEEKARQAVLATAEADQVASPAPSI